MAQKTKYLSYVEETRKHHKIIDQEAKKSSRKAISASHEKSIPITYLEGENIIREEATGEKTTVARIENNRRKVKVGGKEEISHK